MTYNSHRSSTKGALVDEYFEVYCPDSITPYHSTLLPVAMPSITYIKDGLFRAKTPNNDYTLDGIILTGQFYRAYNMEINDAYKAAGITLHPTTLYKLLNTDISKFSNKYTALEHVSEQLSETITAIIETGVTGKKALLAMEKALKPLVKVNDSNVQQIDLAVNTIIKKKGLLSVSELMSDMNISQKTLESQFKKMVGLTPVRFIKLKRFINLMRQYENQDINLKNLIFKYNYYDEAHFYKDFKLFMNETPKNFFTSETDFIKKYINR